MRMFYALATALTLAAPLALVGCDSNDAKVEKKETIETPGGTSTVTETKKIENSSDTAPLAPDANAPK